MATLEQNICDQSSSAISTSGDSHGLPAVEFQITESPVELWCKLDVDALASRVLAEVHVLLQKIQKGERLHGSPFAEFSVRQGPMWNERTLVSQLIEESVTLGLNAELKFARERILDIPNRLSQEAVLNIGLALDANGVWKIEGSGKDICNGFMKAIADREAEAVADRCAASPGGWTPAIITKARLLYDLYKRILKEARHAYRNDSKGWREKRRELLAQHSEVAEVVDKIPVKEHFDISDLAVEVALKRLGLTGSPSYFRKMIYGSQESLSEPMNDGNASIALAVAGALEKFRTKIFSLLS